MYTVTLPTLITRVRQRSNLEGATVFITDAEITDHINQSLSEWWDMVRLTPWGGQYFRKTITFNTTAGQSFYDFATVGASDFVDLISVDVFVSANQAISARPYAEEQRNMFRFFPVGLLLTWPSFYQLQGNGYNANGINFIPAPPGNYQIALNYTQQAPILSGTNAFDSINGWEEWVVLDAAIKCLIKEDNSEAIAILATRLTAQAERIKMAAASRDRGGAEVVHDVTSNFDSWWFDE